MKATFLRKLSVSRKIVVSTAIQYITMVTLLGFTNRRATVGTRYTGTPRLIGIFTSTLSLEHVYQCHIQCDLSYPNILYFNMNSGFWYLNNPQFTYKTTFQDCLTRMGLFSSFNILICDSIPHLKRWYSWLRNIFPLVQNPCWNKISW